MNKKEIDFIYYSVKDFITLNHLNYIFDKIINSKNYGIYNIGSKYGVSINEILNTIFNEKLPINIKEVKSLIKSRTLDNTKICSLKFKCQNYS